MRALLLSALTVGGFGIIPTESYPVAQGLQQATGSGASAGGTGFGYPGFNGFQMPGFGAGFPGQFPFPQPGAGFGQGFPTFSGFPGTGKNFGSTTGSASNAGSHAGTGGVSSGSSAGSFSWSSSSSSYQQQQPHGGVSTGNSGTSHAEQEPVQGPIGTSSGAGSSSQGQWDNSVQHAGTGAHAGEGIGTTVGPGTSHTQQKPSQALPTDTRSLSQYQLNHIAGDAGTGDSSQNNSALRNFTTSTEATTPEDETEAYTSTARWHKDRKVVHPLEVAVSDSPDSTVFKCPHSVPDFLASFLSLNLDPVSAKDSHRKEGNNNSQNLRWAVRVVLDRPTRSSPHKVKSVKRLAAQEVQPRASRIRVNCRAREGRNSDPVLVETSVVADNEPDHRSEKVDASFEKNM
ncbi:AGAP013185-PA-like protein [Anopheles sinensis]|uniref:AGAP013185-PA-like protein n=1 Tax=Anopheles sinensis TaxID=74873 RepID=A0A084W534_ANOSI|nr:AGAP013185-PA-like protein [Anopheles sinensis]